MEISFGHILQKTLQRNLAQRLLHRTCQGDLARDFVQRSSQREVAECKWYFFFMVFATLFGVSYRDNADNFIAYFFSGLRWLSDIALPLRRRLQ